MGKAKTTRKFAERKRINTQTHQKEEAKEEEKKIRQLPPSTLFFSVNEALVPPYRILLDTNFINFSIKNKIEIVPGMMDCLYAKCIPCVTDCLIAELEKLGSKYRLALGIARDPKFERLSCDHKGTYVDDCLVNRVTANRCFIVATCDRMLRKRLRGIPGVPLMNVGRKKFVIEQLPDACTF